VTCGASTLPAQPDRRAAGDFCAAAVSSTISASVSHAPQAAHWPCHLLKSAPQSLQTYAVLALAIEPTSRKPGDQHSGAPSRQRRRAAPRNEKAPLAQGLVVDLVPEI